MLHLPTFVHQPSITDHGQWISRVIMMIANHDNSSFEVFIQNFWSSTNQLFVHPFYHTYWPITMLQSVSIDRLYFFQPLWNPCAGNGNAVVTMLPGSRMINQGFLLLMRGCSSWSKSISELFMMNSSSKHHNSIIYHTDDDVASPENLNFVFGVLSLTSRRSLQCCLVPAWSSTSHNCLALLPVHHH